MTPEELAALAGVVLSLLFKYFPVLNVWYGGLTKVYKQLLMLGLIFVVGLGAFGLSCLGAGEFFGIALECSGEGFWALLSVVFMAGFGNQMTYLLAPETAKVEAAKAARK